MKLRMTVSSLILLFILLLPTHEVAAQTLTKGDRHPDVIVLKENLNRLGFTNFANPNNYYGVLTTEGVRAFQEHYGLTVDGSAGPITLAKINEIISSPFQNGKRHTDTIQLKKDLDFLGYKAFTNPTNYYGVQTEDLVKQFQKRYGLPVSGIADQITQNKIKSLVEGPMFNGLRRDDVIQLKLELEKLGFLSFKNPTNFFGPETEAGVKAFQSFYGLKNSGEVDSQTSKKIDELISTPFQRGKRHQDTIQLKKDLDFLGYKAFTNPTNYYGVQTEDLVKQFQNRYGLPVSGIADQITRNKIKSLVEGPMFNGLRRDDVIQLKLELEKLGFLSFKNPTNFYGPETEAGVKAFQSFYGLKNSGEVDSQTSKKIDELISTPFQRGKRHPDTIQLKKDLDYLGYKAFSNPTTLYGIQTEDLVKQFQKKYGLPVSGIADQITRSKIKSLVEGPMFNGLRRDDVIQLKLDLEKLGFLSFKNPTNFYGPETEAGVKAFQSHYGLEVDGIAGPATLNKISELLNDGNTGTTTKTYTNYNITLNAALNTQMTKAPQTDKYLNNPAYVSGAANYVNVSQQTTISSTGNVNLRTSPSTNSSNNIKTSVGNGTKITVIGMVSGSSVSGSINWYKIEYDNDILYVHSSLVSLNSLTGTIVSSTLNVRSGTNTSSHIFGQLGKGAKITILSEANGWYQISYKAWRNPTRSDVEQYLNPANNNEYQHLVLTSTVGVKASELNKVLSRQGILQGLGQAFIDGGKTHKVNEIYLISHAFLETGRGTSKLSQGVEVGKNKSGKLVLVTDSNRKNLTNIKTTYNMFGIGAVDSNALAGGAIRAYNEGWFTPADAVRGGAKFIADSYIHNSHGQNTLYKMRWNPASPGYPQYATDIGWAVKQAQTIEQLYKQLTNPSLHFDIPVYK